MSLRFQALHPLALDVGPKPDRAEGLEQELGDGRLARAREAVHQNQGALVMQRERVRQAQVLEVLAPGALAVCGGKVLLVRADAGHLCSHQRPVNQVIAQHGKSRVIPGLLQIGVEKAVGEPRQLAVEQVHDQERDLVHDIDPPERLVELDAVERRRLAVDERDVAQVQVAVALANEPPGLARLEARAQARVLVPGPATQALELGHVGVGADQRLDLVEILRCRRQNRLRRAEGPRRIRARDPRVEGGDAARQRVDLGRAERAGLHHAAEQRVLPEAAHLDRVVDRLAVAADSRVHLAARQRHHLEVELRRGAAVQPQLLLAIEVSCLQRAEIEKAEIDRLLELVGIVAGEQHP